MTTFDSEYIAEVDVDFTAIHNSLLVAVADPRLTYSDRLNAQRYIQDMKSFFNSTLAYLNEASKR